jgi:hypothetical protein
MRTISAFLAAPLPGIVLLLLWSRPPVGNLFAAVTTLMIGAWLFQVLPGLPIAILARRLGARFWWHYMITGAIIYAFPTAFVAVVGWQGGERNGGLLVPVACVWLTGLFAGLVFWAIVRAAKEGVGAPPDIEQLRQTFD